MKDYLKKNWKKVLLTVCLATFIGVCLGSMAGGLMRSTANQEVVNMFKDGYTIDEFDTHPTYIKVRGHKNDYDDWKVVKVHWYFISDVTEGHSLS